jgi:hypothetical protein
MRLPVILVQNAPAGEAAYAESLVGNLIGRPGLDLTLVDRFDAITPDSTDWMTLEGITVPSAVLDWKSPEAMMESLARIEMLGTRAPHQLDRDFEPVPGTSSRRLFLFDLTEHRSAEAIMAELNRIRQSLSVKTFSLGGRAGPPTQTKPSTPASEPARKETTPSAAPPKPAATATTVPTPPDRTLSADSSHVTRSDDHLDDLIDQLDDLDV